MHLTHFCIPGAARPTDPPSGVLIYCLGSVEWRLCWVQVGARVYLAVERDHADDDDDEHHGDDDDDCVGLAFAFALLHLFLRRCAAAAAAAAAVLTGSSSRLPRRRFK